MTTLQEKLDQLPEAQRQKVEARAAELIAEETTRQHLRQNLQLPDQNLTEIQSDVSDLDNDDDL